MSLGTSDCAVDNLLTSSSMFYRGDCWCTCGQLPKFYFLCEDSIWGGGYRGGSPTAVRPSDPALCGSCPLVTPYYCRLGDLMCYYVYISPTAVRPSDPALYGSCPLVTPYYCRLGDLLCYYVYIVT